MKKSKKPEVPVGSQEKKETSKSLPVVVTPFSGDEFEVRQVRPLEYEQRTHLQKIFADPVFRQAWQNALSFRPSVVPGGLDSALGLQIGNNRLHQLQGWEMFKTALLREQHERRPIVPKAPDNFPDAGTIEADAASKLAKKVSP